MGFIHADKVEVHVSKGGVVCLKYPFINKNKESDFMYIEIDARILQDIVILINQMYEKLKRSN